MSAAKPRHYIPTAAKLGERRYNRPSEPCDVMRTRDSWLSAQMADTHLTSLASQVELAQPGYRLPLDSPTTINLWQKTFDLIQSKLTLDFWQENLKARLS